MGNAPHRPAGRGTSGQASPHGGHTHSDQGRRAASYAPGIAAGRLDADVVRELFDDLKPPLNDRDATIEADRCFFCHDAPCIQACPTAIDIPLFIRQIGTDNAIGAARTIMDANIFGGMCARVCPTETLCEEACVREISEGSPVKIGALQRFATDRAMARGKRFFTRGKDTGKRVAIVGAGPAGLSCAHELARLGCASVVFDAREKAGGLNEFGIAAYKTTDHFAAREVDYILGIGGIDVKLGTALGRDVSLDDLRRDYDAVFLAVGLSHNAPLGVEGEDLTGVEDAVSFIARLRQSSDLPAIPTGRDVVVIGGGMTAIDAAVQSKRLGAETVTIVYRRGPDAMKASWKERDVAGKSGVSFRFHAIPDAMAGEGGILREARFRRVNPETGKPGDDVFSLAADQVFRAIGQQLDDAGLTGLSADGGRLTVDDQRRTSLDGVWAGGDSIVGNNLTVTAVQDGKLAARSICETLT